MKKPYVVRLESVISERFEVMAENDEEAMRLANKEFELWLNKKSKKVLVATIITGLFGGISESYEKSEKASS